MAEQKLLAREEALDDLSIAIILDNVKYASATDEGKLTADLTAACNALSARGGLDPSQYFRYALLREVLEIPGGYPLAVMRGGEGEDQERLSVAVSRMPKDKLMCAESIAYLSPWQDIPEDGPVVVLYTAAAPITPVGDMPFPQVDDVSPDQQALFEVPLPLSIFDNQQPTPEFVAYVIENLSDPLAGAPRHDLSHLYFPNPALTHPAGREEYPVVDREVAVAQVEELISTGRTNTGVGSRPQAVDQVAGTPGGAVPASRAVRM